MTNTKAISANRPATTQEYTPMLDFEAILSDYMGQYVVIFPDVVDWNIPLFQRPQQIAMAFAQQNVLFFYTTPNYIDKIEKVSKIQDNCYMIQSSWMLAAMEAVKKYNKSLIIELYSTDNLHQLDSIQTWKKYASAILYEYIDELSEEITGKIPAETLVRHEVLLKDPNVYVVATADKLYEEVVRTRGSDIRCLNSSNGVDCRHFENNSNFSLVPEQAKFLFKTKKPVIGYFGALAMWFDFQLVMDAAQALPDYEFALIGPYHGNVDQALISKVKSYRNIHLLGSIDYHVLPHVATRFTVATIPFVINEITESTSPIKLFEYMALEKPIVTTAMRECYKYPVVKVSENTKEYIADLQAMVAKAGDPEYIAQLRKTAYDNSWLAKASEMLKLIRENGGAVYTHDFIKTKAAADDSDNYVAYLEQQIIDLQNKCDAGDEAIRIACDSMQKIINHGQDLSQTKLFQLCHMINRLKHQFLKGSMADKKAFVKWITAHFAHQPTTDHFYNPLYQLLTPLQQTKASLKQSAVNSILYPSSQNTPSASSAPYVRHLNKPYNKYDVIIFSVIDYDFRYQRPQHIADRYAKLGHRVFYVNVNFKPDPGLEVQNSHSNFHQVRLHSPNHIAIYSVTKPKDCQVLCDQLEQLVQNYAICDALMIADYPTWVSEASFLKEKYGFFLMTDYMDDFTGFVGTTEPFLKEACISLLKASDAVAASSQYLVDVVSQYASNVTAIRNGTEFYHFYQAYQKHPVKKARKVIGYYGAIAEWFDFDKIDYLSRKMPDCDIVLIGKVTNEEAKKTTRPNIKLMGEISYKELPKHLKNFDVCLIPFDTSTDLIKATNPVKFYEYLSAAKKIVATEIPELQPYADQYVYLSNDNQQFAEYVERCLNGTDQLSSEQECLDFARQNDWSERMTAFTQAAQNVFPKISIIVLCYNQLDYTKQCLESILAQTAYPNYELIVVDNCSTDDTAAYLKAFEKKDPRVKILLNKKNRGFAGGNNDGIAMATGDYFVLLNNDTIVTNGWLTNMLKRFRNSDSVGIVGAVTNSIYNEARIETTYEDLRDMPAEAYAYTCAHMNEDYSHDGVLAMFCVMFSRELTKKIGLLDENYGVGMFEDDDYSVAAKRAGYDLILPEDVFIHHFGSVSFKKLEDKAYMEIFNKNKAYFENKWGIKWHNHHIRQD